MCKKIILVIILLFPVSVYSQDNTSDDFSIYNPVDDDIVKYYINQLFSEDIKLDGNFGQSGGVKIVGQAVVYFSEMLLVIFLIFLIYSICVGMINLAANGEFLHNQQSATLFIIRHVVGIIMFMKPAGMALPFICVFYLKMVLLASTIGGNIWIYADDNIANFYKLKSTDESQIITEVKNNQQNITNLVNNLVCVYFVNIKGYNDSADVFSNTQPNNAQPNKTGGSILGVNIGTDSNNAPKLFFGKTNGNIPSTYDIACGQETGGQDTSFNVNTAQLTSNFLRDNFNNDIKVHLLPALQKNGSYADYLNALTQYITVGKFKQNLQQFVSSYNVLSNTSKNNSGSSCQQNSNTQYGWITAGMYYYELGSRTSSSSKCAQPTDNPTAAPNGQSVSVSPQNFKKIGIDQSALTSLQNQITSTMSAAFSQITKSTPTSTAYNPISDLFNNAKNINKDIIVEAGDMAVAAPILTFAVPAFTVLGNKMYDVISLFPDEYLFKTIKSSGQDLITTAIAFIGITLGATFAAGLVASIANCEQPAGHVWDSMNSTFSVALFTAASIAFVQGSMLAFYIPLIPVFIYLMAVIGWLMSVIEGFVASPLVALGLVWPGQSHEIFGKSEAAIMLYISIFIRPALIVVGFITGLMLCFIGLQLLALFFKYVIINGGGSLYDYMTAFMWMPLGMIYIGLLSLVTQKCFGITTSVPDKVMEWIGGSSVSYGGADEMLSKVKSSTVEGSQQAMAATQAIAEQGQKAIKFPFDKIREYRHEKDREKRIEDAIENKSKQDRDSAQGDEDSTKDDGGGSQGDEDSTQNDGGSKQDDGGGSHGGVSQSPGIEPSLEDSQTQANDDPFEGEGMKEVSPDGKGSGHSVYKPPASVFDGDDDDD